MLEVKVLEMDVLQILSYSRKRLDKIELAVQELSLCYKKTKEDYLRGLNFLHQGHRHTREMMERQRHRVLVKCKWCTYRARGESMNDTTIIWNHVNAKNNIK